MHTDSKKHDTPTDANNVLADVKITVTDRRSGNYDVWYKKCERCGYDTSKSTIPKGGNKTCWQCGNFVSRDYSDRALNKGK